MPEFCDKQGIIYKLEEKINTGIKVFLFDISDPELLLLLCNKLKKQDIHDVEIWQSMEKECTNDQMRYISKKETEDILDLYRLYDFSDKLSIISDALQYGSMFNYVRTGILTKEEMADALLYKMQNDPEIL